MEENQVSQTAQMTAYYRAYHAKYDTPKIFVDSLADDLLADEDQKAVEELILSGFRTFNPVSAASFPDRTTTLAWLMQTGAASPIVLGRARYAEELLESAVTQGVKQYVILGAGLDTFAFRCPTLAEKLQIFEVDHPATQGYKRHRLTKLGWKHPANLHFVPVDVTRTSLTTALKHSRYDPKEPTFFSWLGVAYYLSRDEVFKTLQNIADIAPTGSSLIFDYLDTDAFIQSKAAPRVLRMLQGVQKVGEPMKSGFDPLSLANDLAACGFCLHEDLSPWDIQLRYFLGRIDHYRACEHAHFVHAVLEYAAASPATKK